MNRDFWRTIAIATALFLLTTGFLSLESRYHVVSPTVIDNARFEDGFDSWIGTPDNVEMKRTFPRTVRVTANPGGQVPLITQPIRDLNGISHLRVSVDLRTDSVVPGWLFWQRAGVFLYSVSRGNRRIWYWPYEVVLLEGTSDWQRHTATIPVSELAGYMQLFVFNASEGGRIWARNIQVESVAEYPASRIVWWALAIAWVMFSVYAAYALLRHKLSWLSVMTCAGAILIVASLMWPQPNLSILQRAALFTAIQAAHSTIEIIRGERTDFEAERETAGAEADSESKAEQDQESAETREQASGNDREQRARPGGAGRAPSPVGAVREMTFGLFNLHATTAAHLFVFAVLAVFARLGFRHHDPTYVLVALVAFALTSEIIQGFTITRSVELEDGVYNAFGAIIGLLMTSTGLAAISRLRRRLRARGTG